MFSGGGVGKLTHRRRSRSIGKRNGQGFSSEEDA